jgi:hypothetical protein
VLRISGEGRESGFWSDTSSPADAVVSGLPLSRPKASQEHGKSLLKDERQSKSLLLRELI